MWIYRLCEWAKKKKLKKLRPVEQKNKIKGKTLMRFVNDKIFALK